MTFGKFATACFAAAVAASAAPAFAHHSFAAEFDANAPVTLKGTITKMEWINPHSWLHVAVKNPDGTTSEWMIEAATPNTLFRRGINKDSLPKGTVVIVDGYQAKDGANRAVGKDLTFAKDGKRLFMGGSAPGAGGEQMFRALKYRRVPTVMVQFPGETHELSRSGKPKHRVERLEHVVDRDPPRVT